MTAWFASIFPVVVCGAFGYCIGSLRDAQTKLDKLQKQIEHLHNKLYESGALEPRRRDDSF